MLAEHAVRHDDLDRCLGTAELRFEIVHVAMAERKHRRARGADALANTEMIELVAEEGVLPAATGREAEGARETGRFHERGEHAEIREIARRKQKRRVFALHGGKPRLEVLV